jgi:integrase
MKTKTLKIKDILLSYSKHIENTVSCKRANIAIKNLSPLYGCSVQEISKNADDFVRQRVASAGTINREIGVLQAALRWSFKRGDINYLPILTRLKSPPPRSKFLSEDEINRLIEASKKYPHVHLFVKIAIMTGQRLEAILSLKWSQVDFNSGLIDFNDHDMRLFERRKGRGIVPMSDSLRDLLSSLNQDCLYVINNKGKRITDFRFAWKKVTKDAGIDITPHILRHTVATMLAKKNVPMMQISRLLGHKSSSITERVYAKFSPDFCKQAVSHLNI